MLLAVAESNHHHTVIFDRYGRCPAFIEYFHKLFARSQNALRGRWENLWAAEEPCVTRLVDCESVVDKLTYAAANPVKDLLVERVHQWPGVHGLANLISGRPLRARRPLHFFRSSGPMPESAVLTLAIPAELGESDQIIAEVTQRVRLVEDAMREYRNRTGKRVLGRRRVLEQSWKDAPTSIEPRRALRPRFAGRLAARITALLDYRRFLAAYRRAREIWLRGEPTKFPVGTYWLTTHASAAVDTP
ncbi:MAG TPA: hypothetical protein VGF94_17860 [Kofleriaceae bacterium]